MLLTPRCFILKNKTICGRRTLDLLWILCFTIMTAFICVSFSRPKCNAARFGRGHLSWHLRSSLRPGTPVISNNDVTKSNQPELSFLYQHNEQLVNHFTEKLNGFGRYKLHLELMDEEPTLVFWILSAAGNFDYREKARKNWANAGAYSNYGIKALVIFCVGLTPNTTVQTLLEDELHLHNDIVQIQAEDTYHNLTYKSIGGLWWTYKNTPKAAMFFKVDDDCRVIPKKFSEWFLLAKRHYHRAMIGGVSYLRVSRGGKWKVSSSTWPLHSFSEKGLQGMGYMITTDLLEDLLTALPYSRWLWIEDAFITGVLREVILRRGGNVTLINLSKDHIADMRKQYFRKTRNPNIFFYGHIEK